MTRRRKRRDRMPAFMLQLDGSPHRWFGLSSSCLMNLIDDASSLNLCLFDHAACLLLWNWMRLLKASTANSYFAADLSSSDGLFGQFCRRLPHPRFFSPGQERSNQTQQHRLIPGQGTYPPTGQLFPPAPQSQVRPLCLTSTERYPYAPPSNSSYPQGCQ
jgi:hypothetical protein